TGATAVKRHAAHDHAQIPARSCKKSLPAQYLLRDDIGIYLHAAGPGYMERIFEPAAVRHKGSKQVLLLQYAAGIAPAGPVPDQRQDLHPPPEGMAAIFAHYWVVSRMPVMVLKVWAKRSTIFL